MTTKEKAESEILKIISLLKSKNYFVSEIEEKNYNFEITTAINKNRIKILVYFGKKGVKTVIQGDTNSDEYKIINELISQQPSLNFNNEKIIEPNNYIGSDECGKGDFFGPLVIAAVYVDEATKDKLKNIGVKDSKKLHDDQIDKIAKEIKSLCKNQFEIVQINPSKYNQLYEKFKNLNRLMNWAHSKAIEELLNKINCSTVITDQFSKLELNISNHPQHSKVNFIQETGAEKFIGVAAASILARNNFNEWFYQKEKEGLKLPKGSSIIVEKKALELLNLIGEEKLNELVKIHFKTLKKIKSVNDIHK